MATCPECDAEIEVDEFDVASIDSKGRTDRFEGALDSLGDRDLEPLARPGSVVEARDGAPLDAAADLTRGLDHPGPLGQIRVPRLLARAPPANTGAA